MIRRQWITRVLVGLLILAIVASGLAGCAAPGPAGGVVKAEVVQSDRPRLTPPSLDAAHAP